MPQGRVPQAKHLPTWAPLESHTQERSRTAFAACDGDGDDRLSIFEARHSIESVATSGLTAFRRLDRDGDGFLQWPEFDRLYRATLERGGPFRIRPLRRLPRGHDEAERHTARSRPAPSLVAYLIRLADGNGDGRLTQQEITAFMVRKGVPAPMREQFAHLDRDGSGFLSPEELQPTTTLLPAPAPGDPAETPPWAAADGNGDGKLQRAELARMLRELDPSLTRWTDRILTQADASGDGALDAEEISPAKKH